MSVPFSFGNVDLNFGTAADPAAREIEPDAPFRLLILGDFTGRANRGLTHADPPLSQRKPIRVDRDNVEELLGRLGVQLNLPVGSRGARVPLRFSTLDDFHPGRLFEQLELFQSLRKTRRRLSNPSTFAEAAREVRSWKENPAAPAAPNVPPAEQSGSDASNASSPDAPADIDGADLLAQALERAQPASLEEQLASGPVNWDAYVQEIVEPYVLPSPDPQQPEFIAAVDQATGRQMDALLHHPDFQSLEALWRAVDLLTRRLETDGRLQVYLLDVSKDELSSDLLAADDFASSGTHRLLFEQGVGEGEPRPWAALIGHYTFGPTLEDVQLLFGLSQIAEQAAAPFLAAADPRLLGCNAAAELREPNDWRPLDGEIQETWDAVRQLPQASWLGLMLPRFLLRLPYGRRTDPVEPFEYEEVPDASAHENYLWGNPALLAGLLLGQAYTEIGWEFRSGVNRDVPGLPLHVYDDDGESKIKPCAEVLLSERAYERIWENGLMPLLSIRDQDAVRAAGFRSLSALDPKLKGRWG